MSIKSDLRASEPASSVQAKDLQNGTVFQIDENTYVKVFNRILAVHPNVFIHNDNAVNFKDFQNVVPRSDLRVRIVVEKDCDAN